MKVCNKCGSQDVAKSVWRHLNISKVFPMDPFFEWCFTCKTDTTVIEEAEYLERKQKEKEEKQKILAETERRRKATKELMNVIQKSSTEILEEIPITVRKLEWSVKERVVRYWVLIKNAQNMANKRGGKVLWESQKGDKVQVQIALKPIKLQRRTDKIVRKSKKS